MVTTNILSRYSIHNPKMCAHDPKAVAIRIDEIPVGYLAREDARSYRRRLGQKSLSGVNATCEAIVVGGGTRRNGKKAALRR
jgi:hypothetical protein